ncbi:hypothetical protein DESPIG_02085 [Desulfovibrio piger ATCC 29098]|uniref:Uncharacterized protein n=1 Tax=Desulfovibrio piger ATCC 29098 TaxID=411464 RepID=B6WVG9_9BACT|nr:hypothetical protein DESPIG_02085 [Desulfovibrio piger ATCC 29098]
MKYARAVLPSGSARRSCFVRPSFLPAVSGQVVAIPGLAAPGGACRGRRGAWSPCRKKTPTG